MGEFTINKEKVLQALGTVQEPDLKQDLVTLNMIRDIEIGINQVTFTVERTDPQTVCGSDPYTFKSGC
jgi:ATP-binding protein involved in chromosome partitioning